MEEEQRSSLCETMAGSLEAPTEKYQKDFRVSFYHSRLHRIFGNEVPEMRWIPALTNSTYLAD